jgi:hypothetical protein
MKVSSIIFKVKYNLSLKFKILLLISILYSENIPQMQDLTQNK